MTHPYAKNWMQTHGGRRFTPFAPTVSDIEIGDIAHSLSMQCRFNGHISEFYSVASHSCRVHDLCSREAKVWGLLHDAAEAYVSDIVSPLKAGLPDFRGVEATVEAAIIERFGISLNSDIIAEVKYWDMHCAFEEGERLLAKPEMLEDWGWTRAECSYESAVTDSAPGHYARHSVMGQGHVCRCFLARFERLNLNG